MVADGVSPSMETSAVSPSGKRTIRNPRKEMRPEGYVIFDEETYRPYIPRTWKTKKIADKELADLLRPYPRGHQWRRRLTVRPWSGNMISDQGVAEAVGK